MARWCTIAALGCSPAATETAPSPPPSDPTETGSRPETSIPRPGDTALEIVPPLPAAPALSLSEAMASNRGIVSAADGSSPDWIELYASEAVSLAGWSVSDDVGDCRRAELPAVDLAPGTFLVLWATGGAPIEGEVPLPFALDEEGETIVLCDPAGREVDRLVVPPLPDDVSYGRAQTVTSWTLTGLGTTARAATALTPDWTSPGFDDAAWAEVTFGIGFDGDADHAEPADVALERPTTQSSDGYGYTGAQAVDGDPLTFSHTADADLSPWIEVDLEAPQVVQGVTLLNRADCCGERLYNLTVTLVDADGAAAFVSPELHPVAEGDAPTSPGSRLDVVVDPPVTASRVRVDKRSVNGAYTSEWLSIAELVVTGSPAAPYGPAIETDLAAWEADRVFLRAVYDLPAPVDRVVADLRWDDVLTVWNGAAVVWASPVGEHDGATVERVGIDPVLLDGIFAFEISTLDADDLLLLPEIVAQEIEPGALGYFPSPTPGDPNGPALEGLLADPTVDPPRGFVDPPFTATVVGPVGATLIYTLDATLPASGHGTVVLPGETGVATAAIEVSGPTVVQAVAVREGWADSAVVTHTWLDLEAVLTQPALPPGVPAVWDGRSESPVAADYEMDPEVVGDPDTVEALRAGLRTIPTLAVTMDPDDLWGPDGIYVHSAERGDDWVRRASLELILPDGTTGFAEACSIQIHGWGWRYHSSTLKHSFRVEFVPEYGPSKLEWPWFADAPVDRFDSIVLRAGGSKTWLDFRDPEQAQYLHDAFARDTARDLGKIDGHATFVHLYLNGLYWGLYNPVERPDAGFGESYLGGDDDTYDAINRRTVTNEAIDGDLEAWNTLLALSDADLSVPENLAAVESMLDLDDLVDYMIIHQYTTNQDGPCCFESNNMRALRRRVDGERFRMFVWDMEYSLWEPTDATNIDVDVAGAIAHVYTRLRAVPAFRERYAARAATHLTGAGALTPEAVITRYETRAAEIYDALLAESARWGDTYRVVPYTRDAEWQAEHDRLVDTYFPERTDRLIEQLRAAGLYAP